MLYRVMSAPTASRDSQSMLRFTSPWKVFVSGARFSQVTFSVPAGGGAVAVKDISDKTAVRSIKTTKISLPTLPTPLEVLSIWFSLLSHIMVRAQTSLPLDYNLLPDIYRDWCDFR